jgi:hypothetical protein
MAAKRTAAGMDHPTIVPSNFDPDAERDEDDEREGSERDRSA